MKILEFMRELQTYGWFRRSGILRKDTWQAWQAFLCATFGEPLDAKQLEIFRKYTARTNAPTQAFDEAWMLAGRGAGKSLAAALILTYVAAFSETMDAAPGETISAMCLASDKSQAAICFRYACAFFDRVPMLKKLERSRTAETIVLRNGATIEIHASDQASLRGRKFVCVVADEIAFWNTTSGSPNSDAEVLNAVKPRMAEGAKLIAITSPYAEAGLAFEIYDREFGRDDSGILVWFAPTTAMNPTVAQKKVDKMIALDPGKMAAEFGLCFRSDRNEFLPRELVESCIDRGVEERRYRSGLNYAAYVDVSGGRSDSFVLSVAHEETGRTWLDFLFEVEPIGGSFDPTKAVIQAAMHLKRFRLSTVTGDSYGGGTFVSLFAAQGVEYAISPWNRTEIYENLGMAIRSRGVVLLDSPKLVRQICGLRQRIGSAGVDRIDHVAGAHDDCANATGGALLLAHKNSGGYGWLDYLSGGQAEAQLADLEKLKGATNAREIQESREKAAYADTCPNCGAGRELIGEIGCEYRCRICAHQWNPRRSKRSVISAPRASMNAWRTAAAASWRAAMILTREPVARR
jgi:hypothetical protein